MARTGERKLTAKQVQVLGAGRHAIGDGLYLYRQATGAASWLFRWKRDGRRREMGLGPYPEVSLAEARKKATEARVKVTRGEDPIAEKRAAAAERRRTSAPNSFEKAAVEYITSKEGGWRNEKHRQQWRNTLATYGKRLSRKHVNEITTEDVLACLKPVWQSKPETASRVRGRIERVLDYANAMGWRSGDNPARWRGHLANILPNPEKLSRGHHGSMQYRDVPWFMARIVDAGGVAAKALAFTILTNARSGEALGATWGEIDMDASTWTVPAERMKGRREHRVPLSAPALQILSAMDVLAGGSPRPDAFVFPGHKAGRPLSGMAMEAVLRRMQVKEAGVTVHGFRSSFSTWAAETTQASFEVREACLAHVSADRVAKAYQRSDFFALRRGLMDRWASYLIGTEQRHVVQLRA